MTTIAYRDGVLAADTLWTAGSTRDDCGPKIERIGNLLVGASGSIPAGLKFRAWARGGFVGPSPFDDKDSGNGIVVWPHGVVCYSGAGPWPVSAEMYALGTGCEFAQGAMAHGATAEEAVRIAMRFDTHTGGEITVLRREG